MNRGEPLGYGWPSGKGGHMGAIHADADDARYCYYLDSKDIWRRLRRKDVRFYEARSAGH